MAEVPLKLIPGVNVEYTTALNTAGISACDSIRFKAGLPQKLGGWTRFYPFALSGNPREIHPWQDLNGVDHLATGTTTQLGVITDNLLTDITPQTLVSDFTPDFSTTSASSTIEIDDPNIANVTVYDAVFFNTPVSVGGLVLQGTYAITVISGTTSYQIEAGSLATSTVMNGGAVPSFTTTSGSNIVTVDLNDHGLAIGNFFTFPIDTAVGGLTVGGTYRVLGVPNANSFTVSASTVATSSTSADMNGGDAQIVYYINLGPAAGGTGFGVGAFGAGGFGSGVVPTSQTGTPITATDWTMDNWGEILLACPTNGSIYQWAPNSGFQNAGLIATAPIFNTGIFIAMPEQILVAYGSTAAAPGAQGASSSPEQQDPLIVRWSDSEDFTNWTPTSTTQAGSFHIPRGSMIVGGLQGPQQALIWTDLGVWAMSYLGAPLVFGFNELGSGCGLIGKHAATIMRGVVFWMSTNNFFMLTGRGVQSIPCPVWDVVFQDIDTDNQDKCRAAANSTFDEIWFFYPSASGGTGEVDRYVKVNISEGMAWDYGSFGRSAWTDQSVLGQPIGVTPHGLIYQHETSPNADGQPLSYFYETGWFTIAEGTSFSFVDWFFPDMKWGFYNGAQDASVQVTISTAAYPNATPDVFGPFTMTSATEFVNTRLRGRLLKVKIAGNDLNSFTRLGNMRFRIAPSGRR